METWKNFATCYSKYGYIQPTVARMDKYFFFSFLSLLFLLNLWLSLFFFSFSITLTLTLYLRSLSFLLQLFSLLCSFFIFLSQFGGIFFLVVGCGSSGAVVETWAMGYGSDGAMVETRFVGFWWSWVMQWWQHGDCGSDGLWVLVDLGGHEMGYELVLRWPNWCWYGDWVAGLVVWCFGGGCAWWLVFASFFFFFFFPVLLVVSALLGVWWWGGGGC